LNSCKPSNRYLDKYLENCYDELIDSEREGFCPLEEDRSLGAEKLSDATSGND
jgi:hypothetical protein